MLEISAPSLSDSSRKALEALLQQAVGRVFPAVTLAVIHRGHEVIRAYGGSNEGADLHEEACFDLASITKLFTATAVLQLVSSGQLSLRTPLCEVIPEFSQSGPRWTDPPQSPHSLDRLAMDQPPIRVDPKDLEIHHLLTHTSGLHDWSDFFLRLGYRPDPPMPGLVPPSRQKEVIGLISDMGFRSSPGPLVYSDLGFILLGEVVARLKGQSLDQVIKADVLSPLRLDGIRFNPVTQGRIDRASIVSTEWDQRWRARRVWGEVHDENACAMGGVAGHAGLFGSARQVAQFGWAWLSPESMPWEIESSLMDQARSVQAQQGSARRGLGFMCKAIEGSSCGRLFSTASFGHTGFTGTSLWIDPHRELVVACLSNAVYHGRNMKPIFDFRVAVHEMLADFFD